MKNFEYAAPRTEAEVLALLSPEPGRTEILAGGTDVIGLMKKMIVTPDRVVNIMEVDTLKGIEPDNGGLLIGAATTLDEVLGHPLLGDYPSIHQAITGINSMQLQCQGTIGGELCQRPRCWFFRNGTGLLSDHLVENGDNRFHAILGNSGHAKFVSSSRLAPALIALGAQVRIAGPGPEEESFIALENFFRTPRHTEQRETILQPNQLLTHIWLPLSDGRPNATYEVRFGEGPDYPLASASACLRLSAGLVREARIVLGQVAPTPWLSTDASSVLLGQPLTESTAERAGEAAVATATPLSENGYKVQLAKVAVKRALLLAAGLETGGF